MTRSRSISFLASAAAVPLIALAAGCGGSGNNGATAATTAPKTASGNPATVSAANEGNLGTILVDSTGRTLYMFQKDSGTKSACFGACAGAWPPLRANAKPTVGGGANASLVGTTNRSDGKPQVTYNGHPVYLFSGDKSPGDTNGEGVTAFGGSWFALSTAGNQVSPSSSSGSSSSGGSIGY
jgi:predicted lipoprotein with Yx(FWY)xxD motif